MPKTLSQRIAERVTKEKPATKKNRAVFLALRAEVEQAMKDGWPVKTIWEQLHAEGKVDFSYQAFRLYTNSLIAQEGAGSTAQQPGQVSAVEASATAATPAPKPAEVAPPTHEPNKTKPPEIPGFDFNTKPQTKDLV